MIVLQWPSAIRVAVSILCLYYHMYVFCGNFFNLFCSFMSKAVMRSTTFIPSIFEILVAIFTFVTIVKTFEACFVSLISIISLQIRFFSNLYFSWLDDHFQGEPSNKTFSHIYNLHWDSRLSHVVGWMGLVLQGQYGNRLIFSLLAKLLLHKRCGYPIIKVWKCSFIWLLNINLNPILFHLIVIYISYVVYVMLFTLCCLRYAAYVMLFTLCCLRYVVYVMLFTLCCLRYVAYVMLFTLCCLRYVVYVMLFTLCCLRYVAYVMLFALCCLRYVVCVMLFALCCLRYVVYVMLLRLCCLRYVVYVMLFTLCCLGYVA